MQRGDVYWVDFEPALGGEIQKTRPAVIVSNEKANATLNRVLVIPLSSQIQKLYPGETLITVPGRTSKAMADQLTVASKLRFKGFIGQVNHEDMKLIESIILFQLGISKNKASFQ